MASLIEPPRLECRQIGAEQLSVRGYHCTVAGSLRMGGLPETGINGRYLATRIITALKMRNLASMSPRI
jgi:hypothetical protein